MGPWRYTLHYLSWLITPDFHTSVQQGKETAPSLLPLLQTFFCSIFLYHSLILCISISIILTICLLGAIVSLNPTPSDMTQHWYVHFLPFAEVIVLSIAHNDTGIIDCVRRQGTGERARVGLCVGQIKSHTDMRGSVEDMMLDPVLLLVISGILYIIPSPISRAPLLHSAS